MAQSAVTVTPPNPTPPTNFQFCGVTGPNPPNFTKLNYADPVANVPPYFDDGTGAAAVAFAANKAALAGGTGATSGGTEDSYPGTGTGPAYQKPNNVGAVPNPSSVAHEGAGVESVATQTYPAGVLVPGSAASYTVSQTPAWAAGDPGGPMRTVGLTPALTAGVLPNPNASHASSLSPAGAPTVTSIAPDNVAAGAGTAAITVTGTNFTPQSVVYVNGVAQTTVFVSSTSLTVAAAPKKATAGTLPVTVRTAGSVESAAANWTFV